jgi:hypothetical protein
LNLGVCVRHADDVRRVNASPFTADLLVLVLLLLLSLLLPLLLLLLLLPLLLLLLLVAKPHPGALSLSLRLTQDIPACTLPFPNHAHINSIARAWR